MSIHPRNRALFLLIAVLLVAVWTMAETASAETVELRNGDIVHGKVLSLDAKTLKLLSESFGELKIKRDDVATIHLHDRAVKSTPAEATDKLQGSSERVLSPNDVLKQLQQAGGINPEDMSAVKRQVPLLATPEVKDFVGERLSGLLSGKLNIQDIRKEAVSAVDQIKDIQKDLGPNGSALNGYLSILENFIRETEEPPQDAGEPKPKTEKSSDK